MKHLVVAASLLGTVLTGAAPAVAAPAAAGTGTVKTGGTALNVRTGASSGSTLAGTIANGGKVAIACRVTGPSVAGTVRTTTQWDRLTSNAFVSDAYIVRGTFTIPVCRTTATIVEPKPTIGPWMLPVAAGIISGFRTVERPSHDGVDLAATRNTPIHAAAAGRVIRVVCNVSAGTCDVDGSPSLSGCGWYVEVQHAQGFVTRYCHMVRKPSVTVGQVVAKGAVLGYVGTSGSSSGPHLHFEVHSAAPATKLNAMNPVPFMRTRGLAFGS